MCIFVAWLHSCTSLGSSKLKIFFFIGRPKFARLGFQEKVSAIFASYKETAKKHSPVDTIQ